MAFDPDKYLAEKAAPEPKAKAAFDPDAYLASKEQKTTDVGSPDNPVESDVFGDSKRVASSFGNDRGIAKAMVQNGFVDAKRNAAGDLVFKKSDGTWHKDAAGFLSHPINWSEAHMGKALPLVGMAAGGTLGAGGGLGGAMVGGGLGGMVGEGSRQAVGSLNGMYDGGSGERAEDMALEGVGGALGEGVGHVVGPLVSPYIKSGLESAAKLGKNVVARGSELMTGVPREAIERLVERPSEVLTPKPALEIAKNASNELESRADLENKMIQQAREKFRAEHGSTPVDTRPVINHVGEFSDKFQPNTQGFGVLSPEELGSLSKIQKQALTTKVPAKPYGFEAQTQAEALPEVRAEDLHKFGDYLGNEVKRFEQSKLPGTGDTRYQSGLRGLYHDVKAPLHAIDPKGLGAADARFSGYADDAKMMGRLDNPKSMEGFVNNYYGKNNGIVREAAQKLIPGAQDEIADLGASRAFTAHGPAGSHMGMRTIGGIVAGNEVYHATHSPVMALATAVSTNPQLHKQIIGRTSQALELLQSAPWFLAIKRNPHLLESIANPELKRSIKSLIGESTDSIIQKSAETDRGVAGSPEVAPDQARKQYNEGN